MSDFAKKDHSHTILFVLILAALLMAAKGYDKVATIEKNAPSLLEKKT